MAKILICVTKAYMQLSVLGVLVPQKSSVSLGLEITLTSERVAIHFLQLYITIYA